MVLQALVILLALLYSPSATNGQGCPELQSSDLGGTTAASKVGLLADILMRFNGLAANPSVRILESNTVCLSQAPLRDRYLSTSVVVRYIADGTESTSQVEFTCTAGAWAPDVSNGNVFIDNSPAATLTTPARADCFLCVSPESAASLPAITTEHCLGMQKLHYI